MSKSIEDARVDADRRRLLMAGGATVLAGLPALSARASAPATSPVKSAAKAAPTRPADQPPLGNLTPDEPDLTLRTFIEAEKLAGIEFDNEQRAMMLQTIPKQVQGLRSRHQRPLPPNDLAPALTFDPRLPGAPVDVPRGPVRFADIDPGPLPDREEDIAYAPLSHLSVWLREREITSTRLTEIYLDRLKRFDPKLECVMTLTDDLAREQAMHADQELDNGLWRGPLHGVPWGAKDLLDTAGIPTTWGATPYRDRVPDNDARVVKLLEEAGAVLVAKLTLGALAYGDIWFDGRTNNPWNLEQGSSGSSAGSAAAVAAGLVGFAIGTETYGSIVSPSMRCGTTGLRPTFGRVSRAGAMALCWSLDKIGPITRTVEDAMMVLEAINGGDVQDASSSNMPLQYDPSLSMHRLRVGYDPAWFAEQPANDLDRQALVAIRGSGARMVEVQLPDWPYETLLTILYAEAAAAFEELTRTGRDRELVWQEPNAWPNTFRQSWFIPAIELVQADRFRREVMQMMAEIFAEVDLLIGPSFGGGLLQITNFTGHPALTVRTGFIDNGRPHGITLIGSLFDEGRLCRAGVALEQAFNVWHHRPPEFSGH